ncbi:putative family transcriptional regulator protein [Erysiphe neolycopersici]|uniref:Putative family transcriptional regulator protein n=1 Tax=Erysiphe neolycopersici TaxID=212602 RepID=A0A420HPU9_9PEZI|nr:putative family transcriptional regulator protein [Erysiphe neolycopersici]
MPSLYQISVPVYIKSLKTLSNLLEKGSSHAAVSNEQLLNSRLIKDMRDFTFQIQQASNHAKSVAERLGKVAPIELKDNEKTIEELQQRIKRTIEILETVKESDFAGEEDEISFKIMNTDFKYTGKTYILEWATPNFYFHFVTAFALLRKEGVNIGKRDFLSWD